MASMDEAKFIVLLLSIRYDKPDADPLTLLTMAGREIAEHQKQAMLIDGELEEIAIDGMPAFYIYRGEK